MQGRALTPYGIVTEVNLLDRDYVTVRRDGQKTSKEYWVGFWEPRTPRLNP